MFSLPADTGSCEDSFRPQTCCRTCQGCAHRLIADGEQRYKNREKPGYGKYIPGDIDPVSVVLEPLMHQVPRQWCCYNKRYQHEHNNPPAFSSRYVLFHFCLQYQAKAERLQPVAKKIFYNPGGSHIMEYAKSCRFKGFTQHQIWNRIPAWESDFFQ
jgi:hypothetical protein